MQQSQCPRYNAKSFDIQRGKISKAQSTESHPEMAPMVELAVKTFNAAIVTMLNDIKEIQSYYECMLTMNEKKCHQKNKTCLKNKKQ